VLCLECLELVFNCNTLDVFDLGMVLDVVDLGSVLDVANLSSVLDVANLGSVLDVANLSSVLDVANLGSVLDVANLILVLDVANWGLVLDVSNFGFIMRDVADLICDDLTDVCLILDVFNDVVCLLSEFPFFFDLVSSVFGLENIFVKYPIICIQLRAQKNETMGVVFWFFLFIIDIKHHICDVLSNFGFLCITDIIIRNIYL
jgi:hypothetical protein